VECTPEVRRVELQPGDTAIVLASDGLWDVLSDSAAVAVVDKVRCCARWPVFGVRPGCGTCGL
jgi:serine/threonine protein phosphatase PrpC